MEEVKKLRLKAFMMMSDLGIGDIKSLLTYLEHLCSVVKIEVKHNHGHELYITRKKLIKRIIEYKSNLKKNEEHVVEYFKSSPPLTVTIKPKRDVDLYDKKVIIMFVSLDNINISDSFK